MSNSFLMHRIFDHRDYLDMIFCHLSQNDLTITIRVNRAWFEASVVSLWKVVDLRVALRLLRSPDQMNEKIVFPDFTSLDNWRRFMVYAQHVRILRASGSDSLALINAILSIPHSLRNDLKYFFPNCWHFTWFTTLVQADAARLGVLLSPSVRHVRLTGRVQSDWFETLCRQMSNNLTSLRAFHVEYENHVTLAPLQCCGPFLKCLAKFSPTLISVWIPEELFINKTLNKLLECNLHSLVVSQYTLFGIVEPEEQMLHGAEEEYADSETPEWFSSMKNLILGRSTPHALVFDLLGCISLPSLTSFSWEFNTGTFDFDTLTTKLSMVAPNLREFTFGVPYPTGSTMPISWISVKRLLNCLKLTSLRILCGRVNMTIDNLLELLKSRQEPFVWDELEIKSLKPLNFQDALLSVAKFSPGIRSLTLCVHDEDSANLFNQIPNLSSGLIPRHARKNSICAQMNLKNQLGESGFFLPCLSALKFYRSSFTTKSIGGVAFLVLAISEPMKLDTFIIDDITMHRRVRSRMRKYYQASIRHLTAGSMPSHSTGRDMYQWLDELDGNTSLFETLF